jgi:hypothetical protein
MAILPYIQLELQLNGLSQDFLSGEIDGLGGRLQGLLNPITHFRSLQVSQICLRDLGETRLEIASERSCFCQF